MTKSRKKPKEGTKALCDWEIRKLKRQCLKLWKEVVKYQAGYKCVVCGTGPKGLQAHHIEADRLNPALRYEPRNGIACCAKHHKFHYLSFHKSFVLSYEYMCKKTEDIQYLKEHRGEKVVFTKENLQFTIEYLMKLLPIKGTK